MNFWQKLFGKKVRSRTANTPTPPKPAEVIRTSRATTAKSPSAGIGTMIEVCLRRDLLTNDLRDKAIRELTAEGADGSRALSGLIKELLSCRSAAIRNALVAAARVSRTPELIAAVTEVLNADSLAACPLECRFTPHIVGGGRVGWDDGETERVRRLAREALTALGIPTPEPMQQTLPEPPAPLSEAVAAFRASLEKFAAGKEHLYVVTKQMKALKPEEAVSVLGSFLAADPDGKLGLAAVQCIDDGNLEPNHGIPIVTPVVASGNPSIRNVSISYLAQHDTPVVREIIRKRLSVESHPTIGERLEKAASQWK